MTFKRQKAYDKMKKIFSIVMFSLTKKKVNRKINIASVQFSVHFVVDDLVCLDRVSAQTKYDN